MYPSFQFSDWPWGVYSGSITDATRDSPSACGVRARKIRGSKSPWSAVSSLLWVLSLEKMSLPCQKPIKIVEVEIDGDAICL